MELGRKAEILVAGILAIGAAGCSSANGKPAAPADKSTQTVSTLEAAFLETPMSPKDIADKVKEIDGMAADASKQLARIDYSKQENNEALEAAVNGLTNGAHLTGKGGADFKYGLEAVVSDAHLAAGNAEASSTAATTLKGDFFLVQGFQGAADRVATYGPRPDAGKPAVVKAGVK